MPAKKKKQPAKPAKKKRAAKKTKKLAVSPRLHTLTPSCSVKNAAEAVKLYQKLFGATVLDRFDGPDGTLAHAELAIGDSTFMIGEPWTEEIRMALAISVPDADAVWKKAIDAGCTQVFPLELQFYGDRAGRVLDPFGNQWMISTHVEDIPVDEQHRRFEKMMKGEAWQ